MEKIIQETSLNQNPFPAPTSPIDPQLDLSPEEKTFIGEMISLMATGIILRKGVISVKTFQTTAGRTIIGYVLQEAPDSYLALLPAVLMLKEGAFALEYVSIVPMVKLFKSNTSMMTLPTPTVFYHYLRLTREKFGSIPGYFNKERSSQVDLLLEQLKMDTSIVMDPKSQQSQQNSPDNIEEPEVLSREAFFISKPPGKLRH